MTENRRNYRYTEIEKYRYSDKPIFWLTGKHKNDPFTYEYDMRVNIASHKEIYVTVILNDIRGAEKRFF